MRFVPCITAGLLATTVAAHPPIGLVVTDEHILFTDGTDVLEVVEGETRVLLADVHAHDLCLVGRSLYYASPDGIHRVLEPWRDDASDDRLWSFDHAVAFRIDDEGAAHASDRSRIVTIDPAGYVGPSIGTHVRRKDDIDGTFGTIDDFTSIDGAVWVLDSNTLRFVEDDRVETILPILTRATDAPLGPGTPDTWSRASAIAPTSSGRVLVACPGDRKVVLVDRLGRVATVCTTDAPWAPSGVTESRGATWVLDHAWGPDSGYQGSRVRRLDASGETVVGQAP